MSYIIIIFIKIYQRVLSPLFSGSCRHYPSCSEYGIEAYQKHGFLSGTYFTVKRILKCNPFFEGGFDPVPEKQDSKSNFKTQNIKI